MLSMTILLSTAYFPAAVIVSALDGRVFLDEAIFKLNISIPFPIPSKSGHVQEQAFGTGLGSVFIVACDFSASNYSSAFFVHDGVVSLFSQKCSGRDFSR